MKCERGASPHAGIAQHFFLLLLQGAWTFGAPAFGLIPPIYLSRLPILSGPESVDYQRVKCLSFNSDIYGLSTMRLKFWLC